MSINWFPGHMTVAIGNVKKALKDHDLVIEVLDARCPMASANPLIESLRAHRQRPCLKVLNKADLADPAATQAWLGFFNAQDSVRAIAISTRKPGDAEKVVASARKLAPHRDDTLKPLRMLIMGVPNVGKSTLINTLIRQRKAKVGDEPAVTKGLSRYELSPTASLTDTPGLMWPRIEDARAGLMLAASHSIGVNAYIESEVALFLAGVLLERYPQSLAARYGVPPADDVGASRALDAVAVIEAVAARRGFRLRGGAHDFEKAAIALLTDYRSGALGRVSLETPTTFRASPAADPGVSAGAEPADDRPAAGLDTQDR